MSIPTPVLISAALPALPWYRSQVMIGSVITVVSSLVVVVPKLAAALGLTNSDAISASVNALFEVFALGSGIYTAVARKNSPIQPVTLTQAAADVHPATLIATKIAALEDPLYKVQPPWSIDMHASSPNNPGNNPGKPSNPSNPSNPSKPGNPGPGQGQPPSSIG